MVLDRRDRRSWLMPEGRQIPADALVNLRRRLDALPPRNPDRRVILESAADLYGVSRATLFRTLRRHLRPKAVRRADRGQPRKLTAPEMERYCEIIAALKIRTSNRKGRHLSTVRAIVPTPSADSSTILTRQTCLFGVPGARTSRSSRARSAAVRSIFGSFAMPRTWGCAGVIGTFFYGRDTSSWNALKAP